MRNLLLLCTVAAQLMSACTVAPDQDDTNSTGGGSGSGSGGSRPVATNVEQSHNVAFVSSASAGVFLSYDATANTVSQNSKTFASTTISGAPGGFDTFKRTSAEEYAIRLSRANSEILLTREIASLEREAPTDFYGTASYSGAYLGLLGQKDNPETERFVQGDAAIQLDVSALTMTGTITNRVTDTSVAMDDIGFSTTSPAVNGVATGQTFGGAVTGETAAQGIVDVMIVGSNGSDEVVGTIYVPSTFSGSDYTETGVFYGN